MLKADRVELAILDAIVGWPQEYGRWFTLVTLREHIAVTVLNVNEGDVEEALMILWGKQPPLIALIDSSYARYDSRRHNEFFSGAQFGIIALPGSRRRQQELSRDNRHGIFISHISEERTIALRLKEFLETASPHIPVFVSSDYESIATGAQWWNAILDGLRHSQYVVVLLSPVSIDRRWINFEAGFGLGQDLPVAPIVWHGLPKSDIGMPLGQLHARELGDEQELKALLAAIADTCRVSFSDTSITKFLADLNILVQHVSHSELEVNVYCDGQVLSMTIRNAGNRPLDMIDAELFVPQQLCTNTVLQAYEPLREFHTFDDDGIRFVGFRLTTHPYPRPYLGINPLRPTLVPGMQEVLVDGLGIAFPHPLSESDKTLPVRYRVSARQASVGPIKIPLGELPPRKR